MTEKPTERDDDISSGFGDPDAPAHTSDEAAAAMIAGNRASRPEAGGGDTNALDLDELGAGGDAGS